MNVPCASSDNFIGHFAQRACRNREVVDYKSILALDVAYDLKHLGALKAVA